MLEYLDFREALLAHHGAFFDLFPDVGREAEVTRVAQRCGVDRRGRPLDDDGIAGRLTLGGAYADPAEWAAHPLSASIAWAVLKGEGETEGNNRGAYMRRLARLVGREGGAWCASGLSEKLQAAYGPQAPESAGARDLLKRVQAWGATVATPHDILAGDVVGWSRAGKSWFGHIGGATNAEPGSEHVWIGEGNVGRYPARWRLFRYERALPDRSTSSRYLGAARCPSPAREC